MKKNLKIFLLLILTLFLLTGCNSSDLKKAYNKMSIGEKKKQINGYEVNVRLYGLYEGNRVEKFLSITNYMNTTYKVVDSLESKTYYKINDKNYRYEMFNNGTGSYMENELDTPYIDTNIYLLSMKNAKNIELSSEKIGEKTYKVYSYQVKPKIMKNIINFSEFDKADFVNNTDVKVWLDNNMHVYKIQYDLKSGLDLNNNLTLVVYYSEINEVSEIKINDMM